MATLPNAYKEKKEGDELATSAQSAMLGSGQDTATQTNKSARSGLFTNMQDYAEANRGNATNMAKNITSKVNENVGKSAENIYGLVGGISENPASDYSGALSFIKNQQGEIDKNIGSVKDFNQRTGLVSGKTAGNRSLNNFLLGSSEAQNVFDTELTNEEDISAINQKISQLATGEAKDILDSSLSFLPQEQEKYNKTKKDADNWYKYQLYKNIDKFTADLQADRDKANSELDRLYKKLNDTPLWQLVSRKNIQDSIDNWSNKLEESSEKAGKIWGNIKSQIPELSHIEAIPVGLSQNFNPEEYLMPSDYSGYSFNQSKDMNEQQQAALEALSQLGGEYMIDETQYGFSPIDVLSEEELYNKFKQGNYIYKT